MDENYDFDTLEDLKEQTRAEKEADWFTDVNKIGIISGATEIVKPETYKRYYSKVKI